MSEKGNGNNPGSGETQEQQGSEGQPEGYPPTSVSFDDPDTVEKAQPPSEGDAADLSQEDESGSKTDAE